jgi:hypothetical protein
MLFKSPEADGFGAFCFMPFPGGFLYREIILFNK